MREIKFRSWYCDNKEMSYWNLEERDYYACSESDNHRIMQYTGLKDKNDKEIYEGDIVQMGYFIDKPTYVNDKIVFHRGAFLLQDKESCTHGIVPDWTEVIGNIYENPDLAEK